MATSTAIKSGNWSDQNVWDKGAIPGPGDIAVIPEGITVTFDEAASHSGFTAPLEEVNVGGKLSFREYSSEVLFWTQKFTGIGQLFGTSKNLLIKLSPPNGYTNLFGPDINFGGVVASSSIDTLLPTWASIMTTINPGDTSFTAKISGSYIEWFLSNVRTNNIYAVLVACDQYQARDFVKVSYDSKTDSWSIDSGSVSNQYTAGMAFMVILSRPVEIFVASGDERYPLRNVDGKTISGIFLHSGPLGEGTYSASSPHITNSGDVTFYEFSAAIHRYSEGTSGNYKVYAGCTIANPYPSGTIFQAQAVSYKTAFIGPGSIVNNYAQLKFRDCFFGALYGTQSSVNMHIKGCTICGNSISSGFFRSDSFLLMEDTYIKASDFSIGYGGDLVLKNITTSNGIDFFSPTQSKAKTSWAPKIVANNIDGDGICHFYSYGLEGVIKEQSPYPRVIEAQLVETSRGYSAVTFEFDSYDIKPRGIIIPFMNKGEHPMSVEVWVTDNFSTPDAAPSESIYKHTIQIVPYGNKWGEIHISLSDVNIPEGHYTINIKISGTIGETVVIGFPIIV